VEQPLPEEIARAAKGDERAFERLITAYHPAIYHYLYRLVGNADDAEDLAQETFLRMARGLPNFAGRSQFTTWLFQIAKNLGVDLLRRREVERAPAMERAVELRPAPTPVGVDGFEEADLLWSCIRQLNVDLRSALVLRDLLGFTYREIAEILETTVATVKWRIYEGRERVQTQYRLAAGAGALPDSLGGRLLPTSSAGDGSLGGGG
jgi:RNA polymerase sigma-70 factor (ECF subfamily)